MKLLLATSNKHKLAEVMELLSGTKDVEVVSAADFPDIHQPEEDGDTFLANARKKALHYADRTGLLTLADDSGLQVDALGGRPGVQSARYGRSDPERISRLLGELEGVPDPERTARFVCAMVLAGPGGEMASTEGVLEGRIVHSPAGNHGFGYDPIFFVPESGCRLAEIPMEAKNAVSHRGRALRAMLPLVLRALGDNRDDR
jgi:XTP/dITP diphosphohydrolase